MPGGTLYKGYWIFDGVPEDSAGQALNLNFIKSADHVDDTTGNPHGITTVMIGAAEAVHDHNSLYYLQSEVDTLLLGKSDVGHIHDDRYYTETEVDALLAGKADDPHNHNDLYYTETEVDILLAGKANVTHTHTEADITDLGDYLTALVEDLAPTLGGNLTLDGNSIIAAGPTTITSTEISYLDGVTSNIQDQINSLSVGLTWRDPVIDQLSTPPGGPLVGDRYIVGSSPTGAWAGRADDIAEWNGSGWDFYTPTDGWAVWNQVQDKQQTYNGAAWVDIGGTTDHGSLSGLLDDDHPQYMQDVLDDATPQLGGDLDVNGNSFSISGSTGLSGQVPTSDGVGGLSWLTPSGSGGTVQGTDGNSYNIRSANTGVGVGGNARGESSVDLQTIRTGATEVASGAGAATLAGDSNTASGQNSATLAGKQAVAKRYGQVAQAAGSFAVNGDAQASTYVMRGTTTNASPVILTLDGTSAKPVLDNYTTWMFEILIVGRNVSSLVEESASFMFRGAIDQRGTLASTALVAGVGKEVHKDVSAWDADVTADTVNGALEIEVTGEVGKNIRWVAFVRTVEVTA